MTTPHLPLYSQYLPSDTGMQRHQKTPERALWREMADFYNSCKDWIEGNEAQVIQTGEADINRQHHGQDELIGNHDAGNPGYRQCLLHKFLEFQFIEHGSHRQQPTIWREILSGKVKGRGSPNFIRV